MSYLGDIYRGQQGAYLLAQLENTVGTADEMEAALPAASTIVGVPAAVAVPSVVAPAPAPAAHVPAAQASTPEKQRINRADIFAARRAQSARSDGEPAAAPAHQVSQAAAQPASLAKTEQGRHAFAEGVLTKRADIFAARKAQTARPAAQPAAASATSAAAAASTASGSPRMAALADEFWAKRKGGR